MEEICNYLIIPTLEDDVDHAVVASRVSERGLYPWISVIKVTETDFQRKKEKFISIRKAGIILAYCGAPFVSHCCQAAGAPFPLG